MNLEIMSRPLDEIPLAEAEEVVREVLEDDDAEAVPVALFGSSI